MRSMGRAVRTRRLVLSLALSIAASSCAAPVRRPLAMMPAAAAVPPVVSPANRRPALARPAIGVAFGGGSARGLAHAGVLRWFEEHRIPIDVAAGTSMGGLIGGAFATGMDAAEMDAMLSSLDWDQLFGSSNFRFKNIRRKSDARAYPSRLEFGLKGGIVAPTALNNGQEVELLLGRIAAPYYGIDHFDELPTPFRAVAVDLVGATEVVLDHGSLAQAMRATMSIPAIFPPVELDGRVLVDGGAMNNVPANVVRAMGADRVVAVNVGDLSEREGLTYTLLGLAGATLDAMMRASTRASIAAADVVIDVPLRGFGPLDWRRTTDLVAEGYAAAEAHREQLLPLSVSEAEYAQWRQARHDRRRSSLPSPAFVRVENFASDDARRLEAQLARHIGRPFDVAALQTDLEVLAGLDRYETVTWRLATNAAGEDGVVVAARPKPYAPPFMMLGLNLENTTSTDFRITATARYLAFDVLGSGSELRLDGTIGSNPGAGVELYQPLGSTPLFVAPYASLVTENYDLVAADAVAARYEQRWTRAGASLGVNLGARSDLRAGAYLGRLDASPKVGSPGLPELRGRQTGADLTWRFDGQDSPVVPSRGAAASIRLVRQFDGPDVRIQEDVVRTNESLLQLSGGLSRFWTARDRGRVFVFGAFGTSFDGHPLPTDQFALGTPLRLGSYKSRELRGDHYWIGSGGYLHQVGRLPDFLGGPVFAGGWLENGDAFDQWDSARWRTNAGAGVVMDTLVGPVILAGSAGFDGRWRTYVGVGRIFR
jgi:NTE family protein